MSNRAVRVALIAALMIAAAVFFWPSREPGDEIVEDVITGLDAGGGPPRAFDPAPEHDERRDWFPDLSAAQPTLTTGDSVAGGSDRFNCSLEDYWTEIDEEELDARHERLAETLSRSANAEDQLAAAMIRRSEDVGQRIDNLTMALASDPLHPLVLWQVAEDCRRGRGGEYCGDPSVRANVDAILGGNGWYWTQVAAFYHEQGMFDESLNAARRAVSAPEFDDYFIDHVLLLERAFSADSDRAYMDRVVESIGFAAAMPGEFLARECAARAEADDSWLANCIMLAERYEQDGTNLMMKMIGLGMQENLYPRSGLAVEARDAEARKGELTALLEKVSGDYQLVQAVDPQLTARYLDIWATSGEVAAFEFTIETVDALLEDPDYDPCVYLPTAPTE